MTQTGTGITPISETKQIVYVGIDVHKKTWSVCFVVEEEFWVSLGFPEGLRRFKSS